MTVPKGSLVKVPTFNQDSTYWEDAESGTDYIACREYTFDKDTYFIDAGR